ncbi:MAG TPA: dihydrodipicolinate synthase family protein [Castellaniella sp.]|nr:dihydrodipicolinate synthase family protein [Castellaniella sp.]
MHWTSLPGDTLAALRAGSVIPAHLLALNADRTLDTDRQRALTRYYLDAGVGGLAVGVHSTQFAIREARLYRPVLELAIKTAQDWIPLGGRRPLVMVAGLAGRTEQAVNEARTARDLGYHAGLLSLAAFPGAGEAELIAHCKAVADVMPLMGFYLQPAVGGLSLSQSFWRCFSGIDNVVAIKMAPFNRYRTQDVIRGVLAAKAEDRVTLYTGNDDHIVLDLLTPFTFMREGRPVTIRVRGGLLGHWSVWTERAVHVFERIQKAVRAQRIDADLLTLDAQITDCNAALFDVAHDFRGCIAGCHEVLRRQGLFKGIWCLDPQESLSPGQAEALTRVQNDYPHLVDDAFVTKNLGRWLE